MAQSHREEPRHGAAGDRQSPASGRGGLQTSGLSSLPNVVPAAVTRQGARLPLGVPSGRGPTPLLTVTARSVAPDVMVVRTTTAFATGSGRASRAQSVPGSAETRTHQPAAPTSLTATSGQSTLRVKLGRAIRSYPPDISHDINTGETSIPRLPTVEAKRSP